MTSLRQELLVPAELEVTRAGTRRREGGKGRVQGEAALRDVKR